MNKINLSIGALCDPISKQLRGKISDDDAARLDAYNKAITLLYIGGYLTDSMVDHARKKLVKGCQLAIDNHSRDPWVAPQQEGGAK